MLVLLAEVTDNLKIIFWDDNEDLPYREIELTNIRSVKHH